MLITKNKPQLHGIFMNEWNRNHGKKRVISIVKKIEKLNPFLFFDAGKVMKEERFFFANRDRDFVCVGVGIAHTIESHEKSNKRFFNIEAEWKNFLQDVHIAKEENAPEPMLFGGFSFDPYKEKSPQWKSFPEAKFLFPKVLLTIIENEVWLTVTVVDGQANPLENLLFWEELEKQRAMPTLEANFLSKEEVSREEYIQAIHQVIEATQEKKIKKAVIARELRTCFANDIDITTVLYRLHEQQTHSYLFAFESGEDCFLGATPEQLIQKNNQQCSTDCLAGSIARGSTSLEDEQFGEWLLHNEKNLNEHKFVVEMIRQTLNEFCEEVTIPEEPVLLKMKHIQHLHTPIHGLGTISMLKLIEVLHPTPAMGGYPKEEGLAIIREIEPLDRGWYAAPIGWMDTKGNGEFVVAIRSALIQKKCASLFAGGGIVMDSLVESEYEETNVKFKPMLAALGGI